MFLGRQLPVILVFMMGVFMLIINFIPHPTAEWLYLYINNWERLIVAFMTLVGPYFLLRMHYHKIKQKASGYGYSFFVFIGFFGMIFAGAFNSGMGPFREKVEGGLDKWLYDSIYSPCSATLFAILAFYMASAAYRSFRAKNTEAFLLLVAAILVMIGGVPIGDFISDKLPIIKELIMDFPQMATKRAIFFGIALGSIATSMRIIFGIERSYLGGE